MMAILKEFRCAAHGPFEAFVKGDKVPKCPAGCSARWVSREIRTAPAARGNVTGRMDNLQKDLAADFKLRDLKVDKEGGNSVINELRKGETQDYSAYWAPANKLNIKEFSPTAALSSLNATKKAPTKIEGSHRGPLPEV